MLITPRNALAPILTAEWRKGTLQRVVFTVLGECIASLISNGPNFSTTHASFDFLNFERELITSLFNSSLP